IRTQSGSTWQSRRPFHSPPRGWSLCFGSTGRRVRRVSMISWSLSRDLPRFSRRLTSLSNCVVVSRTKGGGGSGVSGVGPGPDAFVTTLYNEVLGRAPEPAGLHSAGPAALVSESRRPELRPFARRG